MREITNKKPRQLYKSCKPFVPATCKSESHQITDARMLLNISVIYLLTYLAYILICLTDPTGSGGLRRRGGSSGGYGTERADVCLEVATVTEEAVSVSVSASSTGAGSGQPRSVMVCGGDGRLIPAFVSRGHQARVQLHNPRMVNTIGTFLLRYSGQSDGQFFFKWHTH